MQTTFYTPTTLDLIERADERVRVIDYDEVTMTSRVEFSDGYRAVVPARHLTTREV